MAKGPISRTRTEPVLGSPSSLLRKDRDRERDDVPEETPPPSSVRVETPEGWAPERATGTRHRRQTVTIDEVGAAAVRLAGEGLRPNAPTLAASNATIARAPIDTRAAFILSLVDGRNSVAAIVDMSGMDADEVNAIFDRLVRLGLITLP